MKTALQISSDVSRVLGRPIHTSNPRRGHHDWHQEGNFSKFVPPDAQKMHSLTLSVLRFFVKPFPNYLSLHYKTLFFVDDF